MNDEPGNRPTPDTPQHPAPVPPHSGFPGGDIPEPKVVTFQYSGGPGPLGCVLGALGGALFLVLAVVLLTVGGVFYLLGGRRIAAALFRRALKRHAANSTPFQWPPQTPTQNPDVIDVDAEVIQEEDDSK